MARGNAAFGAFPAKAPLWTFAAEHGVTPFARSTAATAPGSSWRNSRTSDWASLSARVQHDFSVPHRSGMFFLNGSHRIGDNWSHGQALAGALDVAELTGNYGQVRSMVKALDTYKLAPDRHGRTPPGFAPWPDHKSKDRFYDDNAWIGLDLMQAHAQAKASSDPRVSRDAPGYLQKAKSLFKMFESREAIDPRTGLLRWGTGKSERNSLNTCANGPAIEYALRLYQATGDKHYLAWAKARDAAMDRTLRIKSGDQKGLYIDHIEPGKVSNAIYSYNQGTPIGAKLLLYKATHDPRYLDQAKETADAAVRRYGQGDRLWHEPPSFNAIFLRNLKALNQVAPDARYGQLIGGYLDRVRTDAYDPLFGLYRNGGIGSYGGGDHPVLDMGGLIQLFALQAWNPSRLGSVS